MNLKTIDLILTSNFEVFLRLIYQKPQILYAILSLKKPQNFSNVYPQPQKTSNFEAETEDPHILRSRLATLLVAVCNRRFIAV